MGYLMVDPYVPEGPPILILDGSTVGGGLMLWL